MIATNYRKYPAALLAQHEIELVISATGALTKEVSRLIANSKKANVTWVLEFIAATVANITPEWVSAAAQRARKLAKSVKASCMPLTW
jgi:hypothetical protein